MELNHSIRKLARWVFILWEYKFNIVHKVDKVNRDANGVSQIQFQQRWYHQGLLTWRCGFGSSSKMACLDIYLRVVKAFLDTLWDPYKVMTTPIAMIIS
jgi:hypothetical protein